MASTDELGPEVLGIDGAGDAELLELLSTDQTEELNVYSV